MHIAFDPDLARRLIDERRYLQGPLLPILHAMQEAFGFIPNEARSMIAEALNLSRAEVHGVVSFYHDFRAEPAPKLVVKLCRAEACQAMGGREAAQELLRHLGLEWGKCAPDGALVVEPVYCLGLCAAAPAALIGDKPAVRLDGASLCASVEAAR